MPSRRGLAFRTSDHIIVTNSQNNTYMQKHTSIQHNNTIATTNNGQQQQ